MPNTQYEIHDRFTTLRTHDFFCSNEARQRLVYFQSVYRLMGWQTGQSGKYERSYELVLNKKFIEVKNKSIYPAANENQNEDIHEDHGFISYDKSRKTFVFKAISY
jgi:hypothetical protein